ncbi:MAG: hypothetical protein ABIR70_08335 [Bryobacteraceae bacterium]
MAYFPDLSPYAYGREAHPNVFHIGWLDTSHPFPTGQVDVRLVKKLKRFARTPVELYRGHHLCNLCSEPAGLVQKTLPNRVVLDPACSWAVWAAPRMGNGEVRVQGETGILAAPVLIVHYIVEHGYLPPTEFLKAVSAVV